MNEKEVIDNFRQYAEEKLSIHLRELNTRYQNKELDKGTLSEAYRQHQNIYDKELSEKSQSITVDESKTWIVAELDNIRHNYLSRLSINQS